ncbi:MAG: hypothetical protein VKK42_21225 [Lyngbya sp.]|nr:hypothetical protein [Lyngbya sp.]
MSVDPLEQIQTEYRSGRSAFERGRYRQSVQHLETARDLVEKNTRLGGEVQIWLATAYQALGQPQNAIALCKQLIHHPSWETRKQSRRLLEILQAPELKSNLEGLIEIPDMSGIEDNDRPMKVVQPTRSSTSRQPSKVESLPEPIDLTQVNTQDNGFLWISLIAIAAIVGGLFFFY